MLGGLLARHRQPGNTDRASVASGNGGNFAPGLAPAVIAWPLAVEMGYAAG
jgi:hypothetical protein